MFHPWALQPRLQSALHLNTNMAPLPSEQEWGWASDCLASSCTMTTLHMTTTMTTTAMT